MMMKGAQIKIYLPEGIDDCMIAPEHFSTIGFGRPNPVFWLLSDILQESPVLSPLTFYRETK